MAPTVEAEFGFLRKQENVSLDNAAILGYWYVRDS